MVALGGVDDDAILVQRNAARRSVHRRYAVLAQPLLVVGRQPVRLVGAIRVTSAV